MKKIIINEKSGVPLIGHIAFGILSRSNNNLLQVRPTTICNLKCIFCSTGANDLKLHPVNYEVELNYLLKWLKEIIKFKGNNTEILIDSVGEPLTYPKIIELISEIDKIKEVSSISMETNGTLLNEPLIKKLKNAGLKRFNFSIHSLNANLAEKLSGSKYNLNKILNNINLIIKNNIKILLTPVWIPKINDNEIINIIKLAKKLNCRIAIQKYEVHKYGRKVKTKQINWYKFYKQLKDWERQYNIKLIHNLNEFNIEKRNSLPLTFKKNEKLYVKVKAPGWLKNQMIGVAKNRCITIIGCNANINDLIKVKIKENKNNLYIAEPF